MFIRVGTFNRLDIVLSFLVPQVLELRAMEVKTFWSMCKCTKAVLQIGRDKKDNFP